MRILIVGGKGGTNIGGSFDSAARALGLVPSFIEMREAYRGPRLLQSFCWRYLGRFPVNLLAFNDALKKKYLEQEPKLVLATGIAPIRSQTLLELRSMKILTVNYLTDDPWNSQAPAKWFIKTLPFYDVIFSVRKANLTDLLKAGCSRAEYLPFGYDESFFHSEPLTEHEKSQYSSDIMFAGGADSDRVPYIHAFLRAGFKVALYGDYWHRYWKTKKHSTGQVNAATLRKAISGTKIALCLVRRANRDGSCMRTFEVPAVGACMLTEDTGEHREIFGEEGKAVVYFSSIPEMLGKARWLLAHEEERKRLADAGHQLIMTGKHTYTDRLKTMLSLAGRHYESGGSFAGATL